MPPQFQYKRIALPFRGVNLYSSLEDLLPGEAVLTQNCYFRRGVQTKLGSAKHSANEVDTSRAITGLHRFYYGASSKQLIASAGVNVAYMNDGTGVWTNITTGQTDGLTTHIRTWSAVNKCYVSNGTDTPFSWDGTTKTDLTSLPTNTKMVLPYRDRLLFIDNTNPAYVSIMDSPYLDTGAYTAFRMIGGGSVEVIAPHAIAGPQEGIISYVFVGCQSACFLLSGTVLTGSFNTRVDHLSNAVGCISPKTVKNTPKGTIFLGSDRQVYILPFGSTEIYPIGDKIRNPNIGTDGIDDIPLSQLSKACAIYEDGFYKLAVAGPGSTANNYQWWLDVNRLSQDEHGLYGPWFGPMIGMSISEFTVQNGSGDDGRLLGGNGNAFGYVYRVNEAGTFADDGTAITMNLQSAHEFLSGNPAFDAHITKSEVECTNTANTFNMYFLDTTGQISTATAITQVQTLLYWGVGTWGDGLAWNDVGNPVRLLKEHMDKYYIGRQLSTAIDYTSSTDAFQLFSITHEYIPVEQAFQVRS